MQIQDPQKNVFHNTQETSGNSAFVADTEQSPTELAQQIFQRFEVSLKLISLYRYQTESYSKFVAPLTETLQIFHERFGSLTVRVKPFDFYYEDQVVFHDNSDNNLPYKFYREGFRTLTFEKGFEASHLIRFIELLIQVPRELEDVDLAMLLWQADLDHFSYLLLEGFEENQGEQSEAEELNAMVSYLQDQIASDGPDTVNFRGLAEEDLILNQTLSNAEVQRQMQIRAVPLAEDEKQALQTLLKREEQNLSLKALQLFKKQLLQIETHEELAQIKEFMFPILEHRLLQKEFVDLHIGLQLLQNLSQQIKASLQEKYEELLDELLRQLRVPERLAPLFESLEETKLPSEEHLFHIRTYLSILGEKVSPVFIERLSNNSSQIRRSYLELFFQLEFGKAWLPKLVKAHSERSGFLLDLLYVGKKHSGLFDQKTLEEFIDSSTLQLQREGLIAYSMQFPEQASQKAQELLEASNPTLQKIAIEILSKDTEQGISFLIQFASGQSFGKSNVQNQSALYRCLGQTNAPKVFEWLQDQMSFKSSMLKPKIDNQKILAIKGLIACASLQANRFLKEESRSKKHSKNIHEAIKAGIDSLLQTLHTPSART